MAYTVTQKSASSTALLEADYPIILTTNVIPDSTQLPRLDSDFSYGADEADSDFPTINSYNGYTHSCTQLSSDNTSCEYYSHLDSETVDTIFVAMDSNITVNPTYSRIVIADNSAMSTNTNVILYKVPGGSYPRYIYPFKNVGGTYNEVSSLIYWYYDQRYGSSVRHRFIEVWLGLRIQLSRKPLRPIDLKRNVVINKDFISNGGIITRYSFNQGRRRTVLKFNTGNQTELSQYESIWTQSNNGMNPIVFCEKPYSEPYNVGLYKIVNDKYEALLKGPFERDVYIELLEQGGSEVM